MFAKAVVVEVEAIFLVRRHLTAFMSRRAEALVSAKPSSSFGLQSFSYHNSSESIKDR